MVLVKFFLVKFGWLVGWFSFLASFIGWLVGWLVLGRTRSHVEVPWPVIEPTPRLQPVPQLQQCQILNPLCHPGTCLGWLV